MTLFAWTIPTRPPVGVRVREYNEQVALGADQAGFDAVYVPFDPEGDDAVVLGGLLSRVVRQAHVVIGAHAAAGSPVYVAKLFTSLQRSTRGRVALALSAQAPPAFAASVADDIDPADAAARLAEFLEVFGGVWHEDPLSEDDPGAAFAFDGRWFHVDGGFTGINSGVPIPRVYVAEADGPTGTRRILTVPVVARHDAHEAWTDLRRTVDRHAPGTDVDALRTDDGRWTGFGALGLAAPDGFVGSYAEVADGLAALIERERPDLVALTAPDAIGDLYRVAHRILPALDAGRRPEVSA